MKQEESCEDDVDKCKNMINQKIVAASQRKSMALKRVGLVVSVLDSEPVEPGSNLGACTG
jgi:hypothetical protein